jgi:hypothetical protein
VFSSVQPVSSHNQLSYCTLRSLLGSVSDTGARSGKNVNTHRRRLDQYRIDSASSSSAVLFQLYLDLANVLIALPLQKVDLAQQLLFMVLELSHVFVVLAAHNALSLSDDRKKIREMMDVLLWVQPVASPQSSTKNYAR